MEKGANAVKFRIFALAAALFAGVLGASGSAHAQNSQIGITVQNKLTTTSISPSSFNYAGTISPAPASSIPANSSNTYYNTGIGTTTSFHVDYSAASGGKKCHYDAASYMNYPYYGSPYCTFTKAAKSTGYTYATCNATITSMNTSNCSFTVTFSIQ